ncbi:MAG: hypothetical protein M1497_10840 [Nitrospirae bacterium]|nr:hypothetical protein [Nitrospirota bacterium]
MEVTVKLIDKEFDFLTGMKDEEGVLYGKPTSLEDAIHECIRMAMFDESEKDAAEEGM